MSIILHQRVDELERQVAELRALVERMHATPRKEQIVPDEAPVRVMHLKDRQRG